MRLALESPVLLVDDDNPTAERIQLLLERLGFRHVDRATDGLDAWTRLQNRSYDLVICDYSMTPMNGLMFHEALRSEPAFQSVRFVLMTASGDPNLAQQAKAAGVDAFILKPFTMEALATQLQSLLSPCPMRVA